MLEVTELEAIKFWEDVRNDTGQNLSMYIVSKGIKSYLQTHSAAKPSSQDVARIVEVECMGYTPGQRTSEFPTTSYEAQVAEPFVPTIEQQPLSNQERIDRYLSQNYRMEFYNRVTNAYYTLKAVYLEQIGSAKNAHTADIDVYVKSLLHYKALLAVYTAEDARIHGEMDYIKEFLKSQYWRILSDALRCHHRHEHGNKCLRCGQVNPKLLDVHHWNYIHNGQHHGLEHEHLQDLEVMCRRCHDAIEYDKRGLTF